MENIKIENLDKILKENGKIMVQFKTPGCGVCKMNQPIIDKINEENKFNTKGVTIDADADAAGEEDGNTEFAVKLVPTFMFFRDGKKEGEANNFQSKDILEKVMT